MTTTRRRDLVALLMLAACVLVAHAPVVAGGEVFCYEDFVYWFAPTRALVEDALRSGAVAGWDPWVGLGQPLAFNSAAAPLYPLNVLQLALGGGAGGLHRLIVLHLLLGGALVYGLVRSRGVRPAVAWAAGVGWAFSGPLLAYAQENPYHVFGLTWLPAATWGYLAAVERRSVPGGLGAGAAVALMMYGGEPQVWYFAAFTLAATGVACAAAAGPGAGRAVALRAAGVLAGTFALGVALAGAQLATTLAGLSSSVRGQGEPDAVRHTFSMHPLRLVTLLLPYGTGALVPENSLWGTGLQGGYRYWLHTISAGLLPFVALPAALRRGPGRALAVSLLALAGFALWMATGPFGGLYPVVEHALPGLRMFRYPEKWATAAVLPLLLAGAIGLERALSERSRVVVAWAGGLALVGLAVAALAPMLRDAIAGAAAFPAPDLVEAALRALRQDGLGLLLVAGCAAGLLARHAAGRGAAAVTAGVLAGVLGAQSLATGMRTVVTSAPEPFVEAGPVVAEMHRLDPHARFRREPNPAQVGLPRDVEGYVQNQARARWTGALHSLIGVQRHVLVHGPAINAAEGALLHEALWGARPLDGGALLATRFYIVGDRPPPAWLAEAAASGRLRPVTQWPGLRAVLLEDPQARPRAWRVGAVGHDAATPERLAARLAEGFDFARVALLHDTAPAAPLGDPSATGPVRFEVDAPDEVVLATDGPAPGLLVLADSFSDGWRAFVNDVEVPIHRADFALRGVEVPRGPATVRFAYEPPLLQAGLAVTGAAAALALLALLRDVRRRRTRDVSAAAASDTVARPGGP